MSNKQEILISDIQELDKVSENLLLAFRKAKVWAFVGQMGAGKTTLIQSILKKMGIEHLEGSPTYSIVHEYTDENSRNVYHFDLYRIENQEEALNVGVEEMIYGDGLSLIEWPEIIKDILPIETVWFNLTILEPEEIRLLSIEG